MIYNLSVKKRVNKVLLFVIPALCFLVTFAFAENGKIDNPLKSDSLSDLFNNIVAVLIELGTIVSVLGIMYGGFLYATAQGDEEKLGKAYKTITWALVGTAVLLGARTILAAISSTVGQLA